MQASRCWVTTLDYPPPSAFSTASRTGSALQEGAYRACSAGVGSDVVSLGFRVEGL